MSLLRCTFDGVVDMVKVAIERIRTYEDIALSMNPNGYYVAYSGGKDSDCIRILCNLAGVKHELWHNHTTVDAPETVHYIRSISGINIDYPKLSMWKLIVKKKIPPMRQRRYCCSELKEKGGEGRFVITGVRKSESVNRQSRESLEIVTTKKSDKILFNADNTESRRLIENCITKGRKTLNPIIDWEDNDVWDFLKYYGCKSNPLYGCRDSWFGYHRIGCIGCPNASEINKKREFIRYPKYKENYIKAFDKMLIRMGNSARVWKTGEEVFDWWVDDIRQEKQLAGQIGFDDFM